MVFAKTEKLLKFLPKWRNFAKSGHIALIIKMHQTERKISQVFVINPLFRRNLANLNTSIKCLLEINKFKRYS